jgi:DNA-binding NtrC family response regulator
MAKILVIDDDPYCVSLLKIAFEQSGGHAAFTATNGKTGLQAACEEPFDLIITDVLMPEKDGLELILELKKHRPDVKIIAISGGGVLHSEDCLKMAKLFGAQHVMEKPLDINKLVQIANELISPA